MKVRQWAWLLLAGAVAPFVFDNGPDPVSDGLYRVVDVHGRIGYRWEDGDWFCIDKSGSIVKCPSSSNQESGS